MNQLNRPTAYDHFLLVIAVLGAVGTLYSTFRDFGLVGALLWLAFGSLALYLLVSARRWPMLCSLKWRRRWRFLVRTPVDYFFLRSLGVFALAAVIVWASGKGQLRFNRAEFAHHNRFLAIGDVDFGSNYFAEPESEELGSQQARERKEMIEWIQWMVAGV